MRHFQAKALVTLLIIFMFVSLFSIAVAASDGDFNYDTLSTKTSLLLVWMCFTIIPLIKTYKPVYCHFAGWQNVEENTHINDRTLYRTQATTT